MKIIRRLAVFTVMLSMFVCTGCKTTSSISYPFTIQNGDKIVVSVDTSDHFSITQKDGTFTLTQEGKDVLEGTFIAKDKEKVLIQQLVNDHVKIDTYKEQLQALKQSSKIKFIKSDKKDENEYFLFDMEDGTNVITAYVLWVKGSQTGILLESTQGEKVARKAFSKLTVSLVK